MAVCEAETILSGSVGADLGPVIAVKFIHPLLAPVFSRDGLVLRFIAQSGMECV
jgi:hypothetical protein